MDYHRQSIRLKGYDYAQNGYYFVTICVQNRTCLFGKIENQTMLPNQAGKMIQDVWEMIPNHYPGIVIDTFQLMPNHIHGIIVINRGVGAGPCACPEIIGRPRQMTGRPRGVAPTEISLFDVIERFKSLTTNRYIRGVAVNGWPHFNKRLWQRNYWEHIIRNEGEYNSIRRYIHDNPTNWKNDALNG
jgi:putative transposase